MKKVFIFDWGGVLGENNNHYAAVKLSKITGIDVTEIFTELDTLENDYAYVENDIETQAYYDYFSAKYNISCEEFRHILNDVPPNETYFFLKQIAHELGDIYLLSNQLYYRARVIETTCDLSFFKGVYFSCDIGVCKPNKQAYEYVLNKINRSAKDCVFIDDREANLIPATELGMRIILYKDLESLKKELLTIY